MKSGDQFYITISLQASLSVLNLMRNQFGGVAQLVRVPASHAGGPGFEPQRVHQNLEIPRNFKVLVDTLGLEPRTSCV